MACCGWPRHWRSVGLEVDVRTWERVGDTLLEAGEPALALRAYAAGLRDRRRRDESGQRLAGKMGRAYLAAGDPGRAEILLRDVAGPAEELGRRGEQRPAELPALAQAALALADQQAGEGHDPQAEAHRAEARAWLRAGLEQGLWQGEERSRARELLAQLTPNEGKRQ